MVNVILLPGRCSDVAAGDAVGVFAVVTARSLGDLVMIFDVRARGVGRNG